MIKHQVTVTCCECGAETVVTLGVTSTLICQKCGAHKGIINGDKIYRVFCQRCNVWFSIKAGKETNLRHTCGSQTLKIMHRAPAIQRARPSSEKTFAKKISAKVVSIVIPVWNNLTLTQNCINSIRQFTETPYQLVIIDNGSNLEVTEWLIRNLFDNDIIIRNSVNIGFVIGCNQGIKLSTGYYILLLNNDTIVTASNWLAKLIDSLDKADLVGSVIGSVIPNDRIGAFQYVGDGKITDKWSYVEGWCLFAEKELFDKLKGFDEQFSPAYAEDADLSFRIRKMGKKILQVSVPIKHIGQQSAKALRKDNPDQSSISNRLLYKKWMPPAINNILIKRAGAFGDVVFTTPIVKALNKKYPNARIFYETNCPHVLQHNPYIFRLLKTAKANMFDKIFVLEYEKTPQRNCIDVMAEQADVKLDDRKMDFFLGAPDGKIKVKSPYVIFHTGKVWESRQWPIDKFQKVAEYVASKGIRVIEIGNSSTELMQLGKTNPLCTQFINKDWNVIGHLIKNSLFFFGVDSGPSVVAKALQIPSIIVYGCVNPKTRFADSPEHPLYIDYLDCSGCRNKTTDTFIECKHDKVYCLDMITVDMAIKAVDEQLRRLK